MGAQGPQQASTLRHAHHPLPAATVLPLRTAARKYDRSGRLSAPSLRSLTPVHQLLPAAPRLPIICSRLDEGRSVRSSGAPPHESHSSLFSSADTRLYSALVWMFASVSRCRSRLRPPVAVARPNVTLVTSDPPFGLLTVPAM